MLDVIFAVVVTLIYFIVGYKLSQIITVNQEPYSPVIICFWPAILVLCGVFVITSSVKDIFTKK